ncbi:MAG TPA: SatD family protein [Candidatus Mediterraneibacter stercorigallinarum]|uniref:SatD family protein n=1 Tax=Candidatus Mediterraneibacter stercorigallinarum TaxID=2838686 RepID=A0A9D2D8L4_9FIRM|nr:SatD family protein [Candidatus Mediterraneibacter stercorigallinarum]
MNHMDTIHSFAAVIGDIKDSRHLENRKEVQVHLQEILDRLNEKYKDHIVSKFLITLGDEFQGLLCGGEHILDMVNEIRMEMYPVRLRFGIGFGQITTDIKSEMALGADGPGYYRAREAVELLKEREKKNRPVLAELCLRLDEKDQEKEVLLNTVFDLMYVVESGWTERQRETIWDMLLYGDGQQNTARRLSISQPTVQKALAAGSYYTYENALKNASKILGDIQND